MLQDWNAINLIPNKLNYRSMRPSRNYFNKMTNVMECPNEKFKRHKRILLVVAVRKSMFKTHKMTLSIGKDTELSLFSFFLFESLDDFD